MKISLLTFIIIVAALALAIYYLTGASDKAGWYSADNKVSNYVASKLNRPDGLISDEVCLIAKGQIRAGISTLKKASGQMRT